jgi:hypothetical protein
MMMQLESRGLPSRKNRKIFRRHFVLLHLGSDIKFPRQPVARLSMRGTETSPFRSPHYTFSENSKAKFPKMLCGWP